MIKNNKIFKIAAAGAIALFFTATISSCKSGQKCPAYSKYKKYNKNSYSMATEANDSRS